MEITSYNKFIIANRIKVNSKLTIAMWIWTLTGPALALGQYAHIFDRFSYMFCLNVSIMVGTFALVSTLIIYLNPNSTLPQYVLTLGLTITLFYMDYNQVNISLTYILVPIISILYFQRKVFLIASVITYLSFLICAFIEKDIAALNRIDVNSTTWFTARVIAMTIEYLIMIECTNYLDKSFIKRLTKIYDDSITIASQQKEAYTDSLTGLWKRDYLIEAFNNYASSTDKKLALFVMDLDNFKKVNDTYGHSEGDLALTTFTRVLLATFRASDQTVICRFGGDEFVVLLPFNEEDNPIPYILNRLDKNMHEILNSNDHFKDITTSAGVSIYPDDGASFDEIFNNADSTLMFVKHTVKGQVKFYK